MFFFEKNLAQFLEKAGFCGADFLKLSVDAINRVSTLHNKKAETHSVSALSKTKPQLYPVRYGQMIFVSFFFRPAALQMLAVALATSALCALQVKKINSPKFHLTTPHGV